MKKLILWMIKVSKVDIPTEKIVTKVVEKEVYLPTNGTIDGNITIKGDVTVIGNIKVKGSLTCYSKHMDK